MLRNHMLTSTAIIALALSANAAQAQQATGQSATPAAAPAAEAASPSGQVEEIVVTAQKRPENIQEVPLSIVALSGAALANSNVGNAVALQKLVPSLNITTVTFASGIAIRIRGFGSAGNTATDSDVAAYMDGAFIARPGAALASFLDVQSVEVLNGPQGTLFGRNAAMGAISINTNAPTMNKMTLSESAEGGTHGSYSVQAVANVPASDNFAVRIAGMASHMGAIYHNDFDGVGYGRSNNIIGRISAKWNITPRLSWILRGDYSQTDGDGALPNAPYTNTASAAQLAALNTFSTGLSGAAPIERSPPSFEFNQYFGNPYLRDRNYGAASDLSFAVTPVLTLRLIDTFRKWRDDQQSLDTLQTGANILSILLDTNSKSQSHELQLVSQKGAFLDSRLGVTAGLYYFKEDYILNNNFNIGTQYCNTILPKVGQAASIPGCLAGPAAAGVTQYNQTVNSYAAYTQLNFQILPTVEADAGVRRTWDDKTALYNALTPNRPAVGGLLVGAETTPLSLSNRNWSYRGTLSWHITDKTLAFATYSTGYKSGGFNAGASGPVPLNATNRTYGPETVRDVEVGFKSVFLNGKSLLNVTLFDTVLKGFQDRSYNGLAFYVRNSGDVRSRGVDFNGQFRPVPNLSLNYSATYLDAIYLTDTGAPSLEGCSAAAPSAACPLIPGMVPATLAPQNLSGRTIGYAPKWKANGGIDYKYPMADGSSIMLSGSGHYTSSFYTLNTLNPQSVLPGFFTADFRIGFSAPDDRWSIDVFGTNVFNKNYFVALNPQTLGAQVGVNVPATGATLFRGVLGDPSRFGMRLSAKF